jgi:hypothetical protein
MASFYEDERWKTFVDRARKDAVAKIHESALTICISPPSGPEHFDVQQALELGASILMDKPIVLVQPAGRLISGALRRCADRVISLEHDLDLEAGQLELNRKLGSVLDELGLRP